MSRVTMFDPPACFAKRVEELKGELGQPKAELLLHVEIGFALMEHLRLDDEPITAVWVLLSGMPLLHPRLESLDASDRLAIANARQIVPYSSRFAWLSALRTYFKLPQHLRQYEIGASVVGIDLNKIILCGIRNLNPRQEIHQYIYRQCLNTNLAFHRRIPSPSVRANTRYEFMAKFSEDPKEQQISVSFEQRHVDEQPLIPSLSTEPHPRQPFLLELSKLASVAHRLDEREGILARRFPSGSTTAGNWEKRFGQISLHLITNGVIGEANPVTVDLSGFFHLAGMVASGKSTLSLLLAAYILIHCSKDRCTLVVSDAQSAIRLANLINWWFLDDPEDDEPVAVPLLGRSARDKHLKDFHVSKDYLDFRSRNQPHWGERWLGTVCALQGLIAPSDLAEMKEQTIKPGYEPCQSIKKVTPGKRRGPGSSHLCPFFASCPSQQVYRDMPAARIWITTPGGMAMGSLPRHIEDRAVHYGEIVYEQSSLVIFDEADTVINWFDDVYAKEVKLTGGQTGVFDTLGVLTETFSRAERVPSPVTQRWIKSQRDSQSAITTLLTMLSKREGQKFLRDWVARGYFTPNTLFYRLARRICGLEEFDFVETPDSQITANEILTNSVLQHFDALFNETDPLKPESLSEDSAAYELSVLMQEIDRAGDSASDDRIHQRCREWIIKHFPESEQRQQHKNEERKRRGREDKADARETVNTLSSRLMFALSAALLDRHTRIVFYEWHNRPSSVSDEQQPHRRMPASMLDILPLPPTGRQFGTYYSRGAGNDRDNEDDNTLSLFAYTNIGRYYILNFHKLLTDYDGRSGPHVLALSGTSYLPDSTRFHVGNPKGILMPELNASLAIESSRFSFEPLPARNGDLIRISGTSEHQKLSEFKEMVSALIGKAGNGPLVQKLEYLHDLGLNEPTRWSDRERLLLLVNSYDQAALVADEMRRLWRDSKGLIYHLKQVNNQGKRDEFITDSRTDPEGIYRTDIEAFAQTSGKVLIAPMNAIGRGHNILNNRGVAAFGAIYFLTRPYPHPHDTQAIAQEMNRRALDWASDPDFIAWHQGDGILGRAEEIRKLAARYWRSAELRTYYKTLRDDEELQSYPRRDLAATTAGLLIQAVGRLVRGGVPFHAIFVDSAWAPNVSKRDADKKDTSSTSLLMAIIELLCEEYTDRRRYPVGHALYSPIANALAKIFATDDEKEKAL